MKLSILTAVVYSAVSVQATCWCYNIVHQTNRYPYKATTPSNNEATRYACQHWGKTPYSGSGALVCDVHVNVGQWKSVRKLIGSFI
ncbi:hypothetical protein LX32DRAFT_635728 [Colletotrichum zoysiae]|uniref:Secreted protein n=1 Tax=Colletotrichum zoysiae TaxID=1216348 RepID=A0AAD9HPU4_9PEZI|nr:hypothetical protein LX32DRAFT_635728 [Colletotrichum zoysiae]